MKKRFYSRIGAAALALVLALQSPGTIPSLLAADTSDQMVSEPEVVAVETYGDTGVRSMDFDSNWKFYLGDASGAESEVYDDSSWSQVNLPHDYSIEQDTTKSGEAESGYRLGGIGWYRKHFVVEKNMEGKELRIDFGGVYMNATVWINGVQLGTHPYGYTPFSFDITDYVKFGQDNVLTVKVNHQTPSSRWYSGSGIYRSVKLTATEPVHVDLYGTKITTPNLETEKGGIVNMTVKTTVANAGDTAAEVVLKHTIFKKDTDTSIGTVTTAAQSVASGDVAEISATLQANNPDLWSVDAPNLYTVVTEVKVADNVVDTYETDYGFRYFKFDADTGFSLNGENMKLKGVCMHHDQGSLGSEAYYRAIERQVEILKEMGCNSIRVTHNPAADELIEACNKHGILLIEEIFDGWERPKNGNSQDYSKWFNVVIEDGNQILGAEDSMTWAQFDMTATVNRGYNAPSIIMWSLGNEVWEGTDGAADFAAIAQKLINWVKALDSTRPMTIGDNNLKNGSSVSIEMANALNAAGGIVGYNYASAGNYSTGHSNGWCIYGSETASSVNSRGIYGQVPEKQLTSYDTSKVGWGAYASQAWYDIIRNDYVADEYVWTGFDYLGEPTPWNGISTGAVGSWPSPKNSYFGIIDTAGFPKDSYYFYQSQWNDDVTTLHVLPAWNENVVASGNVPIVVYSDAASVELFFTPAGGPETSLGKKAFTTKTTSAGYSYQIYEGSDKSSTEYQNLYLTWYKTFEPGTIRAVAYDKDGKEIAETEGRSVVTTTGEEEKLSASVDRATIDADGKDLAYVTVDVTDADGNIVPDADNRVTFTVEGDGVLVGVDNGNSPDHQSYQDGNRQAFSGKVLAIVQSTKQAGSFTVTATADGLASSSVQVTTTPVEGSTGSGEKQIESFYMSKNYYVKVGTTPELPAKIETRYSDGTTEELTVVWDAITSEQISKSGSFGVNGTVDGKYAVTVVVNMIDKVGGMLNYSTTTPKGQKVTLPEGRPAALADGTVMSTSFAVEWDEIADDVYETAGVVTVNGKANVFGEEYPVTATIRVQEESIVLGSNIAPEALNLTQDIPEANQSDSLEAIRDGSTVAGNGNDSGNQTIWTNYNNAQAGDNTSEIVFGYATQQRIGQIVIYHFKDGYSARYPDAGTTEIYLSDTGEDGSWTELTATETIGTENTDGNVKPYTYDFTAVTATFVKFVFTDAAETLSGRKPCTGIVELEIMKASGGYTSNTAAELGKVVVNGTELTSSQLASGSYNTTAATASVTAEGKDNAAVTILPAYEDKIIIIAEAEDHSKMSQFVINLNTDISADDDSRDYPVEKITPSAGSALPDSSSTTTEGGLSYAFDKNIATHWHSDWTNENKVTNVADRWVVMELEEATKLDAVRYYPRNTGGSNGSVTEYRIEYSMDGTTWTKIASGTWTTDAEWKLAKFDTPVTAKYVKLIGVHTYADSGNDAHMSAAEIRVRMAVDTGDIEDAVDISDPANGVTAEIKPNVIVVYSVSAEKPVEPDVTVKKGEDTLTAGVDYQVTYKDNDKFGEAIATVTGINGYKGSIDVTFEIKKAPVDKSALEEAVEAAKTLKESDYTAETWSVFKSALDAADAIVNDNNANQDAIDKALEDLTTAREALEEAEVELVDKAALEEIVTEAEELKEKAYTEDSWKAFQAALEAAKAVLEDDDADQADVEKALAELAEAEEALTPIDGLPYVDVDKDSSWFYDYVYDVYVKELMTGLEETIFGPNQNLARAQFAVIIYRMEGEPEVKYVEKFPDVADNIWYTDAILWAAENGIVTGYSDTGKFGPSDNITREQMATMMYRYAKYKNLDVSEKKELSEFPDGDKVQEFAIDGMEWCTAKGIISGKGEEPKKLDPQGNTNRAECATIISRYTNLK